jgi:hypothetical protein
MPVKNIFELLEIVFHSLAKACQGGRKQRLDRREIGQLRWRLESIRASRVCEFEVAMATIPVGGLTKNFRSLSGKAQDVNGFKRWYKSNEAKLVDENNLRDLLAASEKSHRARQESGQYPVLRPEDLMRIKQERESESAASAKLEGFLSGTSDNINELLWGTQAPMIGESEWAPAAVDRPRGESDIDSGLTAIETTPTTAVDMVAKLEHAIQLDAVGNGDAIAETAVKELEPAEPTSRRSSRGRSARKQTTVGKEEVGAVALLPAPCISIASEPPEQTSPSVTVRATSSKITPIRSRAAKRQKETIK